MRLREAMALRVLHELELSLPEASETTATSQGVNPEEIRSAGARGRGAEGM